MSKNHLKKGQAFEKQLSREYHQKYTPILVSSALLRLRGCGQADVCYLEKDLIYLVEAKNGGHLSSAQHRRLRHTADFLSQVLDRSVFIKLSFAK